MTYILKQTILKYFLAALGCLAVIVIPNRAQDSKIESSQNVLGAAVQSVQLNPVIKSYPEYSNIIPSPVLSARSAGAFLLGSDSALFSLNADEKLLIASLTKMMTAIVALDKGSLSDQIEITDEDTEVEGNKIGLAKGERYVLEDLILGMIISSGNDAANAVARSVGGTTQRFVEMMNDKARDLKMSSTSFSNPIGLDSGSNYSTTHDLFVLSKELIKYPLLRNAAMSKEQTIKTSDGRHLFLLKNTNKLLLSDSRVMGLKTGYTTLAKGNLITRVKMGEGEVIVIMLNSDNREEDSQKLIDWLGSVYKWD
jgi:D-alanyl-D-alanine carboxypeptidase